MTCCEAALQNYFESLPCDTDDVDAAGETVDGNISAAVDKLPGKVICLLQQEDDRRHFRHK